MEKTEGIKRKPSVNASDLAEEVIIVSPEKEKRGPTRKSRKSGQYRTDANMSNSQEFNSCEEDEAGTSFPVNKGTVNISKSELSDLFDQKLANIATREDINELNAAVK